MDISQFDYHLPEKLIADRPFTPRQASRMLVGDINLDGQINVQDVVFIVSYVLGQVQYLDEEYILSDYNQDGEVNVQDVVAIVSYILSN